LSEKGERRVILTLLEVKQIEEWIATDKHKRECPFGDPIDDTKVYRSHSICKVMFPTLGVSACPCYQFTVEEVEAEALEAIRKGVVG
jgi:hypothetical protein